MKKTLAIKKPLPTASIALIFAAVWLLVATASVFAAVFVRFEAEGGTLTGAVTIQTDSGSSGGSYVQFNQPSSGGGTCPAGQVGTPPNCVSANSALGVNAGTVVNPFDRRMKGFALGNWTFNWGQPYIGNITNLRQAMQEIDPALIRYAGGLKANWIGFDRNQRTPTFGSNWRTADGKTYTERYGTDELRSLDAFAKSINAEVMIQVNITINEPAMWADLVRWAKENNLTSFKYYEFGNEIDLMSTGWASDQYAMHISPTEYANRTAAYQQAMLAVDPTIKIVGGVPASANDIVRGRYECCGNQVSRYITDPLPTARAAGRDLSAVSYHWYQTDGGVMSGGLGSIFNWTFGIPQSSGDWWRQSYSRSWSGDVGPWIRSNMQNYSNTEIGASELNVSSADDIPYNGNHVGALWFSDVLGRMAYSGNDWATIWLGYAGQGEYFSLVYPQDGNSANTTIHARPTYLAYLMYSKYFGDQMVQTSSFDQTRVSIWASRDSDDPGKLKLRITNMTSSAINAPIALNGFSATGGQAYVLSSTNPTDSSAASALSTAPSTINGVKINGNNVAGSLASIQPTTVNVNGTSFNYTIPPYSSVAIVLSGSY